MEIESLDTCINKAMEAVEKSEDSVLRAAVEAARNTVTKELETIIMTEEKPVTGELEMAEYMDRLEDGSLARESVKTALTARDARKLAGDILEQYQGLLKEAGPDITRGQKGELMDKAMESAFPRPQGQGTAVRGNSAGVQRGVYGYFPCGDGPQLFGADVPDHKVGISHGKGTDGPFHPGGEGAEAGH